MFLNTFHQMFQNDAVKSYREQKVLKTLKFEFVLVNYCLLKAVEYS